MKSARTSTSVHDRLAAKLKRRSEEAVPARAAPAPTARERVLMFPSWLAQQLVRGYPAVVHNDHPFMLLFRFDMTDDPLSMDATMLMGSRLDILLVKINSGIYYESSTHMDGLQNRITAAGSNLRVTPEQLLYVCDPASHVEGASGEIQANIMALSYVADAIPAAYVRENREWELPVDFVKHFPTIKEVAKQPEPLA